MPGYCTTARVIPLSKQPTVFPTIGAMITIYITPAINKLNEKIINARITKKIDQKQLIVNEQRGLKAGNSSQHNIADIFDHSKTVKRQVL
jgi:hypothetical protein